MTDPADSLLARRARHVSQSVSILYPEAPITVVRGSRQYLYDAEGRQYLDCVNNDPDVGHSHPRVTEPITTQISLINTNTRFLFAPLVDYAERLTALLPEPLRVCVFVNSGSERTSSRSAWLTRTPDAAALPSRTALTTATPRALSTSVHTSSTTEAGRESPLTSKWYRRRTRTVASIGVRSRQTPTSPMPRERSAAVPESPFGAAAFLAEPLMGTAGQICPPDDYMPGAFTEVRAVGALCIADEVQIGFGRVGTHMWAFDALGALPDIVTFGKPIGNGYPLGTVVTTADIAASFTNGMEYFNTFGGSPVACAVGLAVLEVIAEEGLQQHALQVGHYLAEQLHELSGHHEQIGDVRGMGLFLGVELVTDRDTREPATSLTRELVLALRKAGILVSTDGPDDNVLKIKPPLPFTTDDADRFSAAIDAFLGRGHD